MKVVFEPQVALNLEALAAQTGNEFSGVGFCYERNGDIVIYDAVVLNFGSYVFTQIEPEELLALYGRADARNARVWLHRHPLGNGAPGPHNWSGTDERTIRETPLGGIPEIVQWSVSIVRTPRGWVGRIDNHIQKTTRHLPVEGQADQWVFEKAAQLPGAASLRVSKIAEIIKDAEYSLENIEGLLEASGIGDAILDIGSNLEDVKKYIEEIYAALSGEEEQDD